MNAYVIRLEDLGINDVETVGGKNASLGEMIRNLNTMGVTVPGGFATTAAAYREFLRSDGLEARIQGRLDDLDVDDLKALTSAGREIRDAILRCPLPATLRDAIGAAWNDLSRGDDIAVAVRSSATAEDLPEASFAGQQETFLNVRGLDQRHARRCTSVCVPVQGSGHRLSGAPGLRPRAVALSVGVQRMVRSDVGSSGVMFTLDTESGFRDVVFITSSWGLGETVVQGAVNPDEYYVYKPALAPGKLPLLRKNLGSKAIKMVYADVSAPGRTVDTVEVAPEDSAALLADR